MSQRKQEMSVGSSGVVWAKMRDYPPWPGIVVEPPPTIAAPSRVVGKSCIFFFGTNNFGWVVNSNIQPYEAHREFFKRRVRLASLLKAIAAADLYSSMSPADQNKFHALHKIAPEPKTDQES